MFKKDNNEQGSSAQQHSAPSVSGNRNPAPRKGGGTATIGPSITVKGDVSGDEDLVIQGRVEGTVKLAKHNVTIGGNGRVKADVHGRTVVVEGEVTGDIRAQEQIILRHTAQVEGGIAAPRVALEDGAVFRGSIEMDATSAKPEMKATLKNEPVSADRPAPDGGDKKSSPGSQKSLPS